MMETRSGQRVVVDDIDGAATRPQRKSELAQLTEYISTRFGQRDSELIARQREASKLKLKGDLITLGFDAIDFRRELSSWIALARRLRTYHMQDALNHAHTEQTYAANEQDLKRANAKLVEAQAKADIAPLEEAIERLEAARDEMVGIISWCQSLQRNLQNEEYGDLFESGNEVPTELFQAPIGSKLKEMEH
jgi:hypothetical protein